MRTKGRISVFTVAFSLKTNEEVCNAGSSKAAETAEG